MSEDEIEGLVQVSSVSQSDNMQSLSFSSIQTSLVTSCVPPFHCGSLPKTCGSSSLPQNRLKAPSHRMEGDYVDKLSYKSDLKQSFILTTGSSRERITHLGDISGPVTEKKGNRCEKTLLETPNNDVVVTQPTFTEALRFPSTKMHSTTQSDVGSNKIRLCYQYAEGPFGVPSNQPNTHNKLQTLSDQSTATSFITSNGFKTKSPEPPQQSTHNSVSKLDTHKDQRVTSDEISIKRLNCDSQSKTISRALSSANTWKAKFSAFVNSKTCEPNRASQTHSMQNSMVGETQKLFTPEDLSNELLYPNLYELGSEVYQNKHAKEANFVLQKPSRRPRTEPLPCNRAMTNGLHAENKRAKEGLIEPLATEDDLALKEGVKLLLENASADETEVVKECENEAVPFEAINFALGSEIDNFEREEYVRFKRDRNSVDEEIPPAYILLSISPSKDCNEFDLNIWETESSGNNIFNLENDVRNCAKNVLKTSQKQWFSTNETDTDNKLKQHSNNTNRSFGKTGKVSESENIVSIDCDSTGLLCDADKYLVNSNDLHQAPSPVKNMPSKHPSIKYDSECEKLLDNCNSGHKCVDKFACNSKSENVCTSLPESSFKSHSNEKQRHRRNTQLEVHMKYHKIINHDWTSFDSHENTSSSSHKHNHEETTTVCSSNDNSNYQKNSENHDRANPDINSDSNLRCDKVRVPYEPLDDTTTSVSLNQTSSTTASSSMSQLADCPQTGASRKEVNLHSNLSKIYGPRDCKNYVQSTKEIEDTSTTAWSNSSSSSSSTEKRLLYSSSSSSSALSSSSSESTSSSSKDSSDLEEQDYA